MPNTTAKDASWEGFGFKEIGITVDNSIVLYELVKKRLVDCIYETAYVDIQSKKLMYRVFKNKKELTAAEVNALIAQL